MKTLRRILQWLVGILCGVYLALTVAMLTPPVQRMVAQKASAIMHDTWGWDITIQKAHLEPSLRLILDEVTLKDKQGEQMLHISRVAAKPDLLGIMSGQISIGNAQLFGTQAHLYQQSPDSKPNFQFLIDTFKSKKKKEKSPIDLHIGAIVLRRVAVTWDRRWLPRKPNGMFDTNHLSFSDITLTANLDRLTNDTCTVKVRRFSVKEASGLQISQLSFNLEAGLQHGRLFSFKLGLPHSTIEIPSLEAHYNGLPGKGRFSEWLAALKWKSIVDLNVNRQDLAALITLPEQIPTGARLYTQADGTGGQANLHKIDFSTTDGKAKMTGEMQLSRKFVSADLAIGTIYGSAKFNGRILDMNRLDATLQTDGVDVDKILDRQGDFPLGHIAATVRADGVIKDKGGKPDINVELRAPLLTLLGYEYHGVNANAHISSSEITLTTDVSDLNGNLMADLVWHRGKIQSLDGHVSIGDLAADQLGLWNKYHNVRASADINVNMQGSSLADITGRVTVTGLEVQNYRRDSLIIGPLDLDFSSYIDQGIRTTTFNSQPLQLTAIGRYNFATLPSTAMQLAHLAMPSMIREQPQGKTNDQVDFDIVMQDSTLLNALLRTDISFPEKTCISGWIDGRTQKAQLSADIPFFSVSGQRFSDTHLEAFAEGQLAKADLHITRVAKKRNLPLYIQLSTQSDRIRSLISWNPEKVSGTFGTLDVTTSFPQYPDGSRAIRAWLAPTYITIADTIWQVNPATLAWHDGALSIDGLNVSQNSTNRGLEIDGRMSRNPEDTLVAHLKRINLEYIMDMVNFHSVDFGGDVSGIAKASGLLDNPRADAFLTMEHFMFNHADQGRLKATVNWGERKHHILIDAHTLNAGHGENSDIYGWVRVGDKPNPDAIDLHVDARNFNLAFLNRFTDGILDDMEGRTSGHVRVFGPLKAIDLEGDMLIDTASMYIPTLGVQYTLHKDSVRLRPGVFAFNAKATDKYHHTARITGKLHHTHFKNMRYDFEADASDLLAYDFPDFDDNSFGARIFATGKVNLKGEAGKLTVEANITPSKGSTFTYNVESPDALTEAEFISYTKNSEDGTSDITTSHISSDLYLNFNLQMTPDVKVRLIMNKRSGEAIELAGNGRLMAQYYNKGAFRMYGTYRVESGSYNISVQDVIHKNFTFQQDGTIVFGGDPMQAALNLKALYTVPSVSLNDLTTKSLGFAKTKVNCIMNLTGKPSQPQITFDFDLPDATQDEKQMVRAMVSTDEERNLQAIYLLGLGRFYSYANDATGSQQSSMAVNSLLSSTLSSQLNQFISNAVGNSKWTFGTNLQTGDDGWKNMDVEGQINGSMFNDRLQVTGNFGYREKYYTQHNFISDVDVQYLLTKSGSVAIKAYNQANDRYFVQSSLNTQGVGIQLKKDFDHIRDIFRKKSRKKSTKTEK